MYNSLHIFLWNHFITIFQDYYGNILKNTSDLKSNACVAPTQPIPAHIRQALKRVHPEVTAKCVQTSRNTLTISTSLSKTHSQSKVSLIHPFLFNSYSVSPLSLSPSLSLSLSVSHTHSTSHTHKRTPVSVPPGTMDVGWWCQSAWKAAGFWTWEVAVAGTATCSVRWWERGATSPASTWPRTRYRRGVTISLNVARSWTPGETVS